MPKYAVMIRGVGPENPAMRGHKLKSALESLGFSHVSPVITSGNVVFQASQTATTKLEAMIEAVFEHQLGFYRPVHVRLQDELQALIDANPFPGIVQGPQHYITITFLKQQPGPVPALPYQPQDKGYAVLKLYDRAIAATLDQTYAKTPNLMGWLEKQFGKDITSRTWNTVNRLVDKLNTM